MKVLYIPVRSDEKISYEFKEKTITAHINGKKDIFDFNGLKDGILESIESDLSVNPIIAAEIKNGELKVNLLYYHGKDATEKERFPEWKNHDELKVGIYNGEN